MKAFCVWWRENHSGHTWSCVSDTLNTLVLPNHGSSTYVLAFIGKAGMCLQTRKMFENNIYIHVLSQRAIFGKVKILYIIILLHFRSNLDIVRMIKVIISLETNPTVKTQQVASKQSKWRNVKASVTSFYADKNAKMPILRNVIYLLL